MTTNTTNIDDQILNERAVSEIEARSNAATPGPWVVVETNLPDDWGVTEESKQGSQSIAQMLWREDAPFVAHARDDLPALCATVKHLRAENEDIKNQKWTAERVIAWLDDPNPQPAIHAFTAGNERQIAYRVERIRDDLQSQLEQLWAENQRLKNPRLLLVSDLQSKLAQVEQQRRIAVRFLVKQGYARCAEADHGCDGWHPKL